MTLPQQWAVATPDHPAVSAIARELNLDEKVAACMVNRGIDDPAAARAFLDPKLSHLHRPDGMADLDRAANRMARAIAQGEKIGVFGDYDVDGVSSAAVIVAFLDHFGLEVTPVVGDRFSGYGMGTEAVEQFIQSACSLVVAVDCGPRDGKVTEHAADGGVEIIVVDHHRTDSNSHPDVYAYVNPQREDCQFADKTMAAVGLAFYYVARVKRVLVDDGYIDNDRVDLRSLLDLVALGTVADIVPLNGNNRIFVSHGLRRLSERSRPGLNALIRTAEIRSKQLRASHISFQLSPRLNAAGRLESAAEAFKLLVAKSTGEAEGLALRLDELSKQRRVLENEVTEAALGLLGNEELESSVLVVAGDGWHRGVLGIVAARLSERVQKPTFVVGFDGELGTGSARGHGQVNLHDCLAAAADSLARFGGHRDAAGFTVTRAKLAEMRRSLCVYAESTWQDVEVNKVVCDATLHPAELNIGFVEQLERLGPFGEGNLEPIFAVNGLYVLDKRVVGKEHLKLRLKTPTATVSAFGPRMGSCIDDVASLVSVAAHVGRDDWRGNGAVELRLVACPQAGN